MAHAYTLQTVPRGTAMATAGRLLGVAPPSTLLAIDFTEPTFIDALKQIDHIFTDADGTIVDEGSVSFAGDKVALFEHLAKLNINITIVTGKPLAEVAPLRQSLPASIPINFICEKGAYDVHFDDSGAWREFILSSPEQEHAIAELKEQFGPFSQELCKQFGINNLGFGWAGSGEHKSVLSIDIFNKQPPKNYLSLRGAKRDALKLKDSHLLTKIESAISTWVQSIQPDWRVLHIGNANIEITPGRVGKKEAIIESAEFGAARKALILGDSLNDRGMFALRSAFPGKALTGLVLHRKASLPLVDTADFIMFGLANGNPLLHAVIATRQL